MMLPRVVLAFLSLFFVFGQVHADTWSVNGVRYEDVHVISHTPTAVTIQHNRGISQIPFKDLPWRIQEKFNYDPEKAKQHALELKEKKQKTRDYLEESQKKAEFELNVKRNQKSNTDSKVEELLKQFGKKPLYEKIVDFRPKLQSLELYTSKSQGSRPSCAAFAVLTAAEYEAALKSGEAKRFSEEYLLWATLNNRSTGKTLAPWDVKERPNYASADTGFTLQEVFDALQAYGVLLKEEMPYTWGTDYKNLQAPTAAQIKTAQDRFAIKTHRIPARSREELIDNIISTLNAGYPVVIGVAFPRPQELSKVHVLKNQKPAGGHAVTLVGYKSPDQQASNTLFIFKNSWGPRWGIVGYGFIDYDYLKKYISASAYFVELVTKSE